MLPCCFAPAWTSHNDISFSAVYLSGILVGLTIKVSWNYFAVKLIIIHYAPDIDPPAPPHMISGGGSGGEQSLVLPFFMCSSCV